MENHYKFEESKDVITPALVYYLDIIKENIKKAVDLAGGPGYLWPHVKTHKMAQMVRLQMEAGITRFKCATIAEAEMAASCGAAHVLVAYPLVGPNISRFIQLMQTYPQVCFWAVGTRPWAAMLQSRSQGQCPGGCEPGHGPHRRTGSGYRCILHGVRFDGRYLHDGASLL